MYVKTTKQPPAAQQGVNQSREEQPHRLRPLTMALLLVCGSTDVEIVAVADKAPMAETVSTESNFKR